MATLSSSSQADLVWNPSIDDTGIAGYRVYRNGERIATVTGPAAVDSDVPQDRESCYVVRSVDLDDNVSAPSDEVCLDPRTAWILRVPAPRGDLNAVAWSGERFVAFGDENEVLSSPDGIRWARHPKDLFFGGRFNDVLWDGERFVAVGGRFVYTTTDGIDGATTMTLLFGTNELRALAFSGDLYVAVGEDGAIYTSSDAVDWTAQTSGTDEWLNDVLWTGTEFVAVGNAGTLIASSDGTSWSARTTGTSDSLDGLAFSGSRWVAVGSTTLVSDDGVQWDPSNPSGASNAVTWVESLGLFVAVGYGGTIATSPDGDTWTQTSLTPREVLSDVTFGGGVLVVTGTQGLLYTSTDGTTWSTHTTSLSFQNVVRTRDRFVAIGLGGRLAESPDGIDWDLRWTEDRDDVGLDLASSPSRYVWAGQRYLVSSSDLVLWDERDWLGATSGCGGVVWTGSTFVAVCTSGVVRRSTDGVVWNSLLLDARPSFNDVAWSGQTLVAVSQSGSIFRSVDQGVNWTDISGVTSSSLRATTWGDGQFIAVGAQGTILTSPDGVTWAEQTSGVTRSLRAVVWTGDRFVAVGEAGTVLSSTDGKAWEMQPSDGLGALTGVASSEDRLIVTTSNGEIFSQP